MVLGKALLTCLQLNARARFVAESFLTPVSGTPCVQSLSNLISSLTKASTPYPSTYSVWTKHRSIFRGVTVIMNQKHFTTKPDLYSSMSQKLRLGNLPYFYRVTFKLRKFLLQMKQCSVICIATQKAKSVPDRVPFLAACLATCHV